MLCKYPSKFKNVSDRAAFPCGQCMPCRLNKRRIWSHRIMLEALLHEQNSFLTLTYHDENLPADGSVDPEEHRLFIMRFRNTYRRKFGKELRFYAVGEYGEKTMRPHYHYALFGYPHCMYRGATYTNQKFQPCQCPSCKFVSDIWGKGHILLGELTQDSAQYIAGYVTKKLTSDKTSFQQMVLEGRHPEFARQSRNPGIARDIVPLIATQLTKHNISHHTELPKVLKHGNKAMPLGRYLTDKLYDELGISFADGQKLKEYEGALRSMLLHSSSVPLQVKKVSETNVDLALKLLNSQRILNMETKQLIFRKDKSI